METADVKIARLEEGMVTVKGDTRYIRERLDHLLWKLALISGAGSVVVALITSLIAKGLIR